MAQIELPRQELLDAGQGLSKILTFPCSDPKLSYRLGRIAKVLTREFKAIDTKRNELIRQYCNRTETGEIQFKGDTQEADFVPENLLKFEEEFKNFTQAMISFDSWTLDDKVILGLAKEGLKLTAHDMRCLDFIMDISEDFLCENEVMADGGNVKQLKPTPLPSGGMNRN